MKNKFVIVTHAVLSDTKDIAGPAHNIVSYLDKKNADYLFIRHSLLKSDKTLISFRKNNKVREIKTESYGKFGGLISRIFEGIQTIRITNRFFNKEKLIFIGIDPLNSLWGLILKKTGRVDELISFTVDYSPIRFGNVFLNKIYHFIDRLTLKYSDKAWVVSQRIYDLRIKQGKKEEDLFLVSNAPSIREVKGLINKNPNVFNLISIGTISKAIDFNILIDSMISLVKRFPKLKLTIIGQGAGIRDLEKYIEKNKLSENVILAGSKSHSEVFKILSNQGIGIAIYTDNASWSYYSDSMKARDYLALGLPVIISGNIGTAEEIKDNSAGILIKKDKKELVSALNSILNDKEYYNLLRRNALKLAEKRDMEKVLDIALKEELR